jgi:hypothetical protein
MHLGRSKGRTDEPDTSEFQAFLASRPGSQADLGAIVARNADAWIRARIASGRAGTRPAFMSHVQQARLLRVVVHPAVGTQEVRESEAAVLHRLGELWPEEEELFAAGRLPREHCFLSEQAQREPGVRIVEAAAWEAMTGPERRALFEETRRAAVSAAAEAGLVAALPSSSPAS